MSKKTKNVASASQVEASTSVSSAEMTAQFIFRMLVCLLAWFPSLPIISLAGITSKSKVNAWEQYKITIRFEFNCALGYLLNRCDFYI